jgi:phosphonate transport system ATP-binding protein
MSVRAEVVAVPGTSGAGKTTLFRCIAELISPTAGRISALGSERSVLRGRQTRQVAVMFQRFNLIGRRSALGNLLAGRLGHVSVWRELLGRFSREDQLRAFERLDRVGMLAKAEQEAPTRRRAASSNGRQSPAPSRSDQHHPGGRTPGQRRSADRLDVLYTLLGRA